MMTNEKNQTIAYYDDFANAYAEQTVYADMSAIYEHFEKYLTSGAAVLDAGCGSGRDSLHFMKAGYAVTAITAKRYFLCGRIMKSRHWTARSASFRCWRKE